MKWPRKKKRGRQRGAEQENHGKQHMALPVSILPDPHPENEPGGERSEPNVRLHGRAADNLERVVPVSPKTLSQFPFNKDSG